MFFYVISVQNTTLEYTSILDTLWCHLVRKFYPQPINLTTPCNSAQRHTHICPMKTHPEVLFATLLFLHIVINTISRLHQHKYGDNQPIFNSNKTSFELNFRNYTMIQFLYGAVHFTLVTVGFLSALWNFNTYASWVYLGLLVAGIILVIIIFRNVELSMDKKKAHDCSKEDKFTWVGFYLITIIGLVWFGHMNQWSPIMCFFLVGTSILFAYNQTFKRINPRTLLENEEK